ncbi:MAG: hypothetical protein IJ837_01490 [Clostridia bacterium]|nr:hypothetical protein [Clostridia bacterium]
MILLLSVLTIFSMFLFSACIFTLDTPSISKRGAYISWDKVVSASGYEVVLKNNGDEQTLTITDTKINLSNYVKPGDWSVKVRATTTSLIRNNSEFSNEIEFTVGDFAAPSDFALKEGTNSLWATWTSVMFASTYTIQIDGPDFDEEGVLNSNINYVDIKAGDKIDFNVDLSEYLTSAGEYKFCIQANKVDDDETISTSGYTEEQSYTKVVPLFAPTIEDDKDEATKNVYINGDDFIVKCSTVGNASGYVLSLFGSSKKYEIPAPASGDPTFIIPKNDLPTLNKNAGAQNTDIQIIYVQALSNEASYSASAFSDGKIYYGKALGSANYGDIQLSNPYSKLCGDETFDFYVNTQEELNTLIYFANANRIKDVVFYQDFVSGSGTFINGNFVNKASESYAETKSIGITKSADSEGRITCTFSYKTLANPLKIATTDINGTNSNKEQTVYNKILSYSNLAENDAKRYSVDEEEITNKTKTALPILSKKDKTLNVYTSDQLYLAVQAGYYPIFVGDSPAKTIWEKAIDVLVGTEDSLGIIDDNMTQEQKLLAIFDWVCYTSKYDYNLSSRSSEEGVQNYRGFYLEGMFLDNGQAVCDGISKAYSLLSNMAGLEVYKVIGNASGESHAWNYAGIYDEETEKYTYYMVDCTWNDITLSETDKETLVHRYFLVANDGKHSESWPQKHTLSGANYPYFSKDNTFKLNGTTYSYYIENNTINNGDNGTYMSTLIANLNSEYTNNDLNYLEIRVAWNYYQNFDNAIDSNWSRYIYDVKDSEYKTYLLVREQKKSFKALFYF